MLRPERGPELVEGEAEPSMREVRVIKYSLTDEVMRKEADGPDALGDDSDNINGRSVDDDDAENVWYLSLECRR